MKAVQQGSALIESLILMGVLTPMFVGISLLGKYLDVKAAALEASRYAVWERTVWSGSGAGWNEGENRKADNQVAQEANALVMGHPSAGIDSALTISTNPLWVSRRHEQLLAGITVRDKMGNPMVAPSDTTLRAYRPPATMPLVDQFAFKGLPGDGLGKAVVSVGDKLGKLNGGCGTGIDFNQGLGLGSDNFIEAKVSIPVRNFLRPGAPDLSFLSRAAILSNSWMASDPEIYRKRVDRLTVDELVACAVIPGRFTFAVLSRGTNTPLYGEGIRSYPVLEAFDAGALPPERLK